MTTVQKIGYGIGGFSLSLVVALLVATALQALRLVLVPASAGFLVTYGSMLAIAIIAIASTWVCLLQSLRNEAMVRGVWCQIYTLVAIATISLLLTLWI